MPQSIDPMGSVGHTQRPQNTPSPEFASPTRNSQTSSVKGADMNTFNRIMNDDKPNGINPMAMGGPVNSGNINQLNMTPNTYPQLDAVVSFDEQAGFQDAEIRNRYQTTLRSLYDESSTFQNAINTLADDNKNVTFTREVGAKSEVTPHGGDTDDGQNYTINVDETRKSTYVAYDPVTQTAYAKDQFSLPRYLVHETLHTLGLRDNPPLPEYVNNLTSLESGKNLVDNIAAGLEGTDSERQAEAISSIAPGPVVRMTNQILNESNTFHEDPRVMYNTLTQESPESVQAFVSVLDPIIDEDYATDQDYDLLYLDPLNNGQTFGKN